MYAYDAFFASQLQQLRQEQRYRRFRVLARQGVPLPHAEWVRNDGSRRPVVVWCSNDYLGMSQHPTIVEAATEALSRYGSGAGGTRNISGTHELIVELEAELADLHRRDAALVFTSGYIANDTVLATLGQRLPGATFFSDAHNHASMIEGMRRSGAPCRVFRHNSADDLKRLLAASDPMRPRIVAFESLYSMDGDVAPLQDLVRVAKQHGALIFVDETHAVGVHGPGGAGLVAAAGLGQEVDLVQGGLGKAYGALGGFVTGRAALIDFLRSYAPGFIFTTALPPPVSAAALAAIRHLRASDQERTALWTAVGEVRAALARAPYRVLPTQSQILPLIIGDGNQCERLAENLLEREGIYLQPINFPTVTRGTERFRITPTARHDAAMTEHLVAGLQRAAREIAGLRAA